VLLRRWTVVDVERAGVRHVLHSRETSSAHPGSPALVLVHGSGTTSRYFRPLLQVLDELGAPAAAVELPGIGASSGAEVPRTVAGLADVLADWLRTTGRGPTTLVGNSMGTQIVTDTAIRHPELVEGLVLIGPTVDHDGRNLFEQAGKLLVDATRERPSLLAVAATDPLFTSRRAVWTYVRAALRQRLEQRLPLVRAPTLIVRGARDPMVPRDWCEHLVGVAREARLLEIPGAAHATHHGAPERVAELVVAHRERAAASGRAA
jgi:pimeloyl-ACP methyl ester carboxylesterase